jgi:hypothetical protein
MAYSENAKSTELDELTALDANDVFIVGDYSDSGRAKKITKTNIGTTIDDVLADSSTTVKGLVKMSTAPASATEPIAVGTNDNRVAPTSLSTVTSGQVEALIGGSTFGTPSSTNKFITQAYNSSATGIPVVRTYTWGATVGSSTTRFDITKPSGSTFRYTWDGTGTDPGITTTTFPTGATVHIFIDSATAANNGVFTVTGSGTNYFEVTNGSGIAENDKIINDGWIKVLTPAQLTWTKPTGLKYVTVELVGGGQAGGAVDDSNGGRAGGTSSFGSHLSATGGQANGTGGVGSNGDINVSGKNCNDFGYGDGIRNGFDGADSYFAPGGVGVGHETVGGAGVYGSGGAGHGTRSSGDAAGAGGAAGGYSRKLIATASLGATESVVVGDAGIPVGEAGAGGGGLVIVTEYYS